MLTSLGDLITIINSYDKKSIKKKIGWPFHPTTLAMVTDRFYTWKKTAGYSSNALSVYFHELGNSQNLNELVQNKENDRKWAFGKKTFILGILYRWKKAWLGLENLTLGGPYGEPAPEDLEFVIQSKSGYLNEAQKYPVGNRFFNFYNCHNLNIKGSAYANILANPIHYKW